MEELSLHILDIVENSISAGASLVSIYIEVNEIENLIKIVIEDNGKGMSEEEIKKAMDPFYTSKVGKKVGLGLPMFAQIAEACDGYLKIESEKGKGTKVIALMRLDHVDRPPLGDLSSTLFGIIVGHSDVDFSIHIRSDKGEVRIDTREIKEVLGGNSLTHPKVIGYVRESIESEIKGILKGGI